MRGSHLREERGLLFGLPHRDQRWLGLKASPPATPLSVIVNDQLSHHDQNKHGEGIRRASYCDAKKSGRDLHARLLAVLEAVVASPHSAGGDNALKAREVTAAERFPSREELRKGLP